MKSSTLLDSVVFQLTPTRTRCDLVISANGKTEKIASGLVNPFLAHLKTAQEQMAKGGYSIILEPEPGSDATWFTKETIERFVRFVSTPEVLERVYTLESEILQINEAIAIQNNTEMGSSTVEDHQAKPMEHIEGTIGKPMLDSTEEKAIVLYKPDAHLNEANGSTVPEGGNSKVQLMKVLETRKIVLQKEQGMAFARAVAAGFDMDNMAPLMSFAESFGALRLMDACVRFMQLWKRKHETGQWVEIEAAEPMPTQSEISAMNTSGIILSNTVKKQCSETTDNGKTGVDPYGNPPVDQQSTPGQHPQMFAPWPVHSPPGAFPVFQGYPMQGVPYYPNYPVNSPFFLPPYASGEDPRINAAQSLGRGHSIDSNMEPEAWEVDALKTRSQDDADLEDETLGSQERGRKVRSNKKQSGMVVIRNINYITSKRQKSSGSESESASDYETDEDEGDLQESTPNMKRSLKGKGNRSNSVDKLNSSDKEKTHHVKKADGEQWQAFQSFLLKGADEAERNAEHCMFATEKDVQVKRRQNRAGDDLLVYGGREVDDDRDGTIADMQKVSGKLTRRTKASNDESLVAGRMGQASDSRRLMDVQSIETNGRRGGYRTSANDDFIIGRRENQAGYTSDPLAGNGLEHAGNDLDRSSHHMDDASYIVSLRSLSLDHPGNDGRNAVDMDSEFPSSVKRVESQTKYEPDALSLIPERGAEKCSVGYDPALDYDMEIRAENGDKKNKETVSDVKQSANKGRKSKLTPDASDKKKTVGPIKKGKPSKLSPLDEARARAERLRSFKADLQKMKKEKEQEEIKRLEALKLQRQKRISARSSSIPSQSALPQARKSLPAKLSPVSHKGSKFSDCEPGSSSPLQSSIPSQSALPQARKSLPAKLSPVSHKGSKFSDCEPGSSSPLQRFSIRTVSVGSTVSLKGSKSSKLSTGSQSAGSRISQSVSSLPETKKENGDVTPDAKASMARIRRLSEPKMSSNPVSSIKLRNTEPASKSKVSNGPESRKVSAIVNHDKTMAATLPELKIRTKKGLDLAHGRSATKEPSQKVNGSKSTTSNGIELKRNTDRTSYDGDGDDNPIIEKTVVMLECEKPSLSAVPTSKENVGVRKGNSSHSKEEDKTQILSVYAAIRAPVSPLPIDKVDREAIRHQIQEQPSTSEVVTENASNMKELPKVESIRSAEKPYQAPYARVSSLEDPCTGNSEYGKAPPTSLQTAITSTETVKVHVSNSKNWKLEKISETVDKPQSKETSRGFKRLLKFGRKSHATGELDSVSINNSEADDGIANAASSKEVHTLKNLISQDETPIAGGTPQKTSRHFSLLSPFRSKTSAKKLQIA